MKHVPCQQYGVTLALLEPSAERLAGQSRAIFNHALGPSEIWLRLVAADPSDTELFAQIEFDTEVVYAAGEPFSLSAEPGAPPFGEGRILGADSRPLQRRQNRTWLRRYQTLAGGGALSILLPMLAESGGVARLSSALKALGWSRAEWEQQLPLLLESDRLHLTQDKVWMSAEYQRQKEQTLNLLKSLQAAAGWRPGWRREELARLLGVKSGRNDGFFDLLESLSEESALTRRGSLWSTSDYQPTLPPDLEAAATQLEEILQADGVAPRDWEVALSQVTSDPKSFAMLSEHLLGLGRVEKLSDKLVFSPSALAEARESLRTHSQGLPFSTSQAKEWLDISRKFIIPVLEWMDDQGWTERQDDERTLKG